MSAPIFQMREYTMNEVNPLCQILKILHRKPCSQVELCEQLGFSKSHMHKLVSNLVTPGIIKRSDSQEYEQEQGRPRQKLTITHNLQYCSVLVIHTSWKFRAYLLAYGLTEEIAYKDLPQTDSASVFIKELTDCIDEFTKLYLSDKKSILSIVIATQATIEQGENGIMYRNNLLKDENITFAKKLREAIGIRCFVYNYAYGHMLSLLHAKDLNTDNAMVLSCGEGSVALGIFLNNQLLLGRNNSFPECSHLPFKYGFEKSLGEFGEHTKEALLFAINAIAPIYNINHVILAGSCFDNHLNIIYQASLELKEQKDPLLQKILLEYRGQEIEQHFLELVYLSFDSLVEVLNPQMQKRNLEELVKSMEAY